MCNLGSLYSIVAGTVTKKLFYNGGSFKGKTKSLGDQLNNMYTIVRVQISIYILIISAFHRDLKIQTKVDSTCLPHSLNIGYSRICISGFHSN